MKKRLIIRKDGEGGYYGSLAPFGVSIRLMTETVEDNSRGYIYTYNKVIDEDLWQLKFFYGAQYEFEYLIEKDNIKGIKNAKKMAREMFRNQFQQLTDICSR